jgi:dissimilatory sulfite reductase (desulfoviridin) alpha/beta subunit
MPIYNEIFESYRKYEKEELQLKKMVDVLKRHGYIVYKKKGKHTPVY